MQNTLTVINVVEDYTADNTGVSDASDAINNALAAVPTGVSPNIAQGAIVYFPRGTYLINKPLRRQVSFTRCVGEGKSATVIFLNDAGWQGTVSPADPAGSFMFDLQSYSVTDCAISDMRIDGAARTLTSSNGTTSDLYSGILCSARSLIERVQIYDVWGYGLWIFGQTAEWTTLLDCDADRGTNAFTGAGGNDCIGGGGRRVKVVRFYWMPSLAHNSALDFTAGGGSLADVSVDIIDCINESSKDVVLEGCMQSTVRGSRFYGNNVAVKSDGAYAMHTTLQNPADILVADNIFIGQLNPLTNQYAGGSCLVTLDGGVYCPGKTLLNNGGRIAILGNSFINSASTDPTKAGSAIRWAGDDKSNSDGGSVISGNRIINPNANGVTTTAAVPGGCGGVGQGSDLGCGIAVLSSYGLTIGRNTINDTSASQNMQYAMQLFSSTALPSGAVTAPIVVQDNLCGSAPGVGNGKLSTFYVNPNPNNSLPLPILRGNTDQPGGYDSNASAQLLSSNGTPWPGAGGYSFDAEIYVTGGNVTKITIGATDTGRKDGAFYLPAGDNITIAWTTQPTIKVFRVAT